jgi:hypothetical protein
MAAVAVGNFPVQPGERIRCFIVIEIGWIQVDQLKILAIVFRVAVYTILFFVPVKTFVLIYSCGQVFVAFEAFGRIGLFPGSMAFDTIFYTGKLSMNFTEFSRRYQEIEFLTGKERRY